MNGALLAASCRLAIAPCPLLTTTNRAGKDPKMIRHVVLVKLKAGLSQAEIDAVFAPLAALKDVLPGMLGFGAGANVSPEGMNRGYSHAFMVDFPDAAARDAYLDHPAHKAAGAKLVEATEGGRDGLVVLDLAVEQT
jgi:hypothetical protein